MSFALWTATSIAPASSASSISLTNSRLPPTSDSGADLQAIARRLDDDELGGDAGRLEPRRDGPRLPQRQRAAARADAQRGRISRGGSAIPRRPSRNARRTASSAPSLNSRFNASE